MTFSKFILRIAIVTVLIHSSFEADVHLYTNEPRTSLGKDASALLEPGIVALQKCCPQGSILIPNGPDRYSCAEYIEGTRTKLQRWSRVVPIYQTPSLISNISAELDFGTAVYFPKCEKCVVDLEYRVLQGGIIIISGPNSHSGSQSLVWLTLSNTSFCIDRIEEDGELMEVILVCKESLMNELRKIEELLKRFIGGTIAEGAKATGLVSVVSASVLGLAIAVYVILWKEHNVHGWTQFSFLLALFWTYLIAGIRRLVGFETLNFYGLGLVFEALEDFGAVSTSANLVALSFDLLYTLSRSLPTYSKADGLRRFVITTTLSWTAGIVVMGIGLVIKSGENYDFDATNIEQLKKYFRKLLEFFLCIQNDMLFSSCFPIAQLSLFSINLFIFLASVVVLYRKQTKNTLAYENIARSRILKFWIRRILKLFLLMGFWWPLSVICVFDCISMFNYTVEVWKEVLATFYLGRDSVTYETPWHMYLISNCLAVQAVVICCIFVWNRKTMSALKKRYPRLYVLGTI